MATDERIKKARRTGRRVTLALFVVMASAFVVLTTWQFTVQAFDLSVVPASPACATALRGLEAVVDRATTSVPSTESVEAARARFERAIAAEDDAARTTCSTGSGPDEEAYAAARRFAMAARQQAIVRTTADVAAARRSLESRLP